MKEEKSALRGRFEAELAPEAGKFIASIPFDKRLFREDILGSIAHTKMLQKLGILSPQEADLIIQGLSSIQEEIERGEFVFREDLEDIHMNIEARLYEKIGEIAGKLHTARSRNDQIALDMRLFVKRAIKEILKAIRELQKSLLELAEKNMEVIMPGFTHLQHAQPVLFAHHLLAYFEMLQRDKERFEDALKRTDVLPLGSGALAGVSFPVDREFLAQILGFSRISRNSIDAVSDRDFIIEFQSASAIMIMHLSRLAEELVLWSSPEFGFVEIDDAYAAGSSIMPQKKNPDVAELVRAKSGRIFGNLLGILTVMKGLPLSYNRDLQEDKEGLFDTFDNLLLALKVMKGVVQTLKVNKEKMEEVLRRDSFILATDIADYLVRKGVPFREAHQIAAEIVRYALKEGKDLLSLSLDEYKRFSERFEEDVLKLDFRTSAALRDVAGGTAPGRVEKALEEARKILREEEGGGG